jgi:hypothetical protein
LFGILAYYVYLIGYYFVGEAKEMKLWILRRLRTKQTHPVMLDIAVAGAIIVGELVRDRVSREVFEEASLLVEIVQ